METKKNPIWVNSTLKISVPITDFLSDPTHLYAKQNYLDILEMYLWDYLIS